nr:MAG TPA: hypothetical protein [Caudoviricetes sp.]
MRRLCGSRLIVQNRRPLRHQQVCERDYIGVGGEPHTHHTHKAADVCRYT